VSRDRSWWLKLALAGTAAALVCLEIVRPLRRRRHESKVRRVRRNAAIGGLGAAAVQLCEQPIVMPLARYVEQRRWGLLQRLSVPPPLRTILALVALDYTLYWWHIIVHRVPLLWRFHRVHHADVDLDASTAIRFHFGELIASVPWRAAQIVIIGVDPHTLTLWQTLTLLSVLFHHSNVRLSPRGERVLGTVLVTPRMHGIHHSREADEMASNWSSGLSVWDRLHGTLRMDVPQDDIVIGVNDVGVDDATLPRMLAAPFEAITVGPHPPRW
jgi:sterol desaturase/sphingolipid hydroxylase (fatty acid hydroxylase superfamily)